MNVKNNIRKDEAERIERLKVLKEEYEDSLNDISFEMGIEDSDVINMIENGYTIEDSIFREYDYVTHDCTTYYVQYVLQSTLICLKSDGSEITIPIDNTRLSTEAEVYDFARVGYCLKNGGRIDFSCFYNEVLELNDGSLLKYDYKDSDYYDNLFKSGVVSKIYGVLLSKDTLHHRSSELSKDWLKKLEE